MLLSPSSLFPLIIPDSTSSFLFLFLDLVDDGVDGSFDFTRLNSDEGYGGIRGRSQSEERSDELV